jgi:hypothetical protein
MGFAGYDLCCAGHGLVWAQAGLGMDLSGHVLDRVWAGHGVCMGLAWPFLGWLCAGLCRGLSCAQDWAWHVCGLGEAVGCAGPRFAVGWPGLWAELKAFLVTAVLYTVVGWLSALALTGFAWAWAGPGVGWTGHGPGCARLGQLRAGPSLGWPCSRVCLGVSWCGPGLACCWAGLFVICSVLSLGWPRSGMFCSWSLMGPLWSGNVPDLAWAGLRQAWREHGFASACAGLVVGGHCQGLDST